MYHVLFLTLLTLLPSLARSENAYSIRLPKSLDCVTNSGQSFRIYTRVENIHDWRLIPDGKMQEDLTLLESNTSASIANDELFSRHEYFTMKLNRQTLTVATWTCDSSDFTYAFKTSELIKSPGEPSADKQVQGTASIEIRGEMTEQALNCQARY